MTMGSQGDGSEYFPLVNMVMPPAVHVSLKIYVKSLTLGGPPLLSQGRAEGEALRGR